jgi:hypothetical protein
MYNFVFLPCFLFSAAVANTDQDSSQALNLARSQWVREVNFKCTYAIRMKHEMSSKIENVFEPHFFDRELVHSSGSLIKLGQLTRLSVTYREKTRSMDVDGNHKGTLNVPREHLANSTLNLTFFPDYATHSHDGDAMTVGAHAIFESLTNPTSGERSSRLLQNSVNPLFPRGDSDFDMTTAASLPGCSVAVVGVMRTASSIEVRTSSTGKFDSQLLTKTTATRWLTDRPVPIVERIEEVITDDNSLTLVTTVIKLLDFQACGNGEAPRRIVHAVATADGIDAVEWKSKDLGEVEPSNQDFVLRLPPSARVFGLKQQPASGNDEIVIDMNVLSTKDLESPGDIPLSPHQSVSSLDPSQEIGRSVFFLANVGVVLVLIVVVLIRHRHR